MPWNDGPFEDVFHFLLKMRCSMAVLVYQRATLLLDTAVVCVDFAWRWLSCYWTCDVVELIVVVVAVAGGGGGVLTILLTNSTCEISSNYTAISSTQAPVCTQYFVRSLELTELTKDKLRDQVFSVEHYIEFENGSPKRTSLGSHGTGILAYMDVFFIFLWFSGRYMAIIHIIHDMEPMGTDEKFWKISSFTFTENAMKMLVKIH